MARIAVISAAHLHTRGYLENLTRSGDGRSVVAIWDSVADRGRRMAGDFATPFVSNLEKLLADPDVDGFLVCAETVHHLPLLERLLPIGKPILCDKPLVPNVKEAKRLKKLLETATAPVLTGYFMPHFGDHRAIVNLLKGEFFGKVTRVRCRCAHAAAYGRWFETPDLRWFTDPELACGGGFFDMGTHALHLLRYLFGPITEVSAHIGNESGIYPKVDDFGVAQVRFESGVHGLVEAGWTQTGGLRQLEIVGSEKTLWHNGYEYRIEGPNFPQESLYVIDPSPARVDRLVAAIRGQIPAEELKLEIDLALQAVVAMEACYKSAEKGKWVKVGC